MHFRLKSSFGKQASIFPPVAARHPPFQGWIDPTGGLWPPFYFACPLSRAGALPRESTCLPLLSIGTNTFHQSASSVSGAVVKSYIAVSSSFYGSNTKSRPQGGRLSGSKILPERGIVRFPEFRSYLSIRQQQFPHWDMLLVTGYGARLPLLNHFGFGRICFFITTLEIQKSSRMEGNRNTWVLLRVRFKFLGAWRIGWSSARGLVRFAFYTYSRKNFILYH